MGESSVDDYVTTITTKRSTADKLLSMRRKLNPPDDSGPKRRIRENVDEVINRLIDFYEENHTPTPNRY